MSFFRKKAEKHTADKKKNVTLETFDGDILLSERLDRRILPDVPDPTGQRTSFDRRGVVDGSGRCGCSDEKAQVRHPV